MRNYLNIMSKDYLVTALAVYFEISDGEIQKI